MTRRTLLQLTVAPLAAAAPAANITSLEVLTVKVNQRGNWLLARMNTSAGVHGIGDASHGYTDRDTMRHMQTYFERLRGRPAWSIEWLRQLAEPEVLKSRRPAAVALSALEQCMWDIQGKLAGVPCWQFFGGKMRDQVRLYANINRASERTPAGFARMAESAVRDGFTAVKLAPFDTEKDPARAIEIIAAVRKAIGPVCDLLIDAHSRFDLAGGLELVKKLEPFNLFWLEEVTKPEHLPAIDRAAPMMTAGGEYIYGVRGFLPYIKAGSVDVAMPDVKYCGGMLELKKISALVEAAGLKTSPHGPASPVGNMSAAQVCVTMPSFLILEHAYGEVPWRAELVDPPERIQGGMLRVPDTPGLGLTLNNAAVKKYAAASM
jgi:galactonate dehydratase